MDHREPRLTAAAGQPGLIIPTMPLMVGVLADFYLGVTVDRQLTRLSMLGFVGQSDLARAELSRNGLYLRVGPGQLSPFSLLPDFLRLPRPLNAEYLAFVEAWQERATALVEQLRGVIEREDGIALSAAAGRRIVDLVREQLWSIQCGSLEADPGACQGSWMMKSGLAPLFERLREVFGLAWPLPELDDDPIAFRNMVADEERIAAAGVGNLLEALLRDQLPVVERVALYRHLLTDQGAIRQLQADRRVLDHVTNGRHQSLPGRIGQIERRVERLDLLLDLLPETEPVELPPTDHTLPGPEGGAGLGLPEAEQNLVQSIPTLSANWRDEFPRDSWTSQPRVLYQMAA
ncbi:MAG: hypothetical protein EBZ36_16285, partial [Acidobacteria bacterium]|nr:hypothetical protein [Acidobacteriota bacterium]